MTGGGGGVTCRSSLLSTLLKQLGSSIYVLYNTCSFNCSKSKLLIFSWREFHPAWKREKTIFRNPFLYTTDYCPNLEHITQPKKAQSAVARHSKLVGDQGEHGLESGIPVGSTGTTKLKEGRRKQRRKKINNDGRKEYLNGFYTISYTSWSNVQKPWHLGKKRWDY